MKNATGEIGNLLVVSVCVAILVAFFYYAVWPIINHNFVSQTACEKAICEATPGADGMVNCVVYENNTVSKSFKCRYKG